ncbi:hypothetical protein [Sphingomonas bacterium]|uniref:hypothetical protein n=1 Tax=Sphingomonas bacterium TaxID=1895847 RepID=UPI00157737D0|nr:hypothetical protein [Sphingomonas bacterium]
MVRSLDGTIFLQALTLAGEDAKVMTWVWFGLFVLTLVLSIGMYDRIRELEDRLGLSGPDRYTRPKQLKSTPPAVGREPTSSRVAYSSSLKPRSQHRGRWSEGETGPTAVFTYVDLDGVVTDRDVRNWRSDGPHINAYCLLRRARRTFHKDRIGDWAAG